MKIKNGFTVIETLVAIGLFGIGILALIGFYAFSSQTVKSARQTTVATNLAQELLEETVAKGYDALSPGDGTKIGYSTSPTDPYYSYQKQINVSLVNKDLNPSAEDLGLKKIDVYVYWILAGQPKQVQISTLIAQK